MNSQNSLTVNFNCVDGQIRPRAFSDASGIKAEKKQKDRELPTIFIEETEESDDFQPITRQRAYTSPEELFRRPQRSRPGTPPPCDVEYNGGRIRKQSSLGKLGAQPHKLYKVPEK